MKRIIDGLTYNTDTSTLIARSQETDEGFLEQRGGSQTDFTLYQTRGGAFFVHAHTKTHRRNLRTEEWEEVEQHEFSPMTFDRARRWVMEGETDLLNDVFGEPPEAADEETPGATIYVRLPVSLKDRIEAAAAANKISVNAWAIRCMEGCVASQRAASAG